MLCRIQYSGDIAMLNRKCKSCARPSSGPRQARDEAASTTIICCKWRRGKDCLGGETSGVFPGPRFERQAASGAGGAHL